MQLKNNAKMVIIVRYSKRSGDKKSHAHVLTKVKNGGVNLLPENLRPTIKIVYLCRVIENNIFMLTINVLR